MIVDKDTLLIWSHFSDYMFYEAEHYYTFKGKRVKWSVTQFVSSVSQPFDKETMSQRIAEKQGCTQKEILDNWQRNADISCCLGTIFHLRSELYAQGKQFEIDYAEADKLGIRIEVETRMKKLIPMQDRFFSKIKGKLIPLKTEFTVGLGETIAGNIDLLCWNEKEQEIQIWDYKTNKEIKMCNEFGKKMLHEFSDLDDCEYIHYSIQLGIYKEILQTKLGIKIGKCYLAYFNERNSDFIPIKCMDLSSKCKMALNRILQETMLGDGYDRYNIK